MSDKIFHATSNTHAVQLSHRHSETDSETHTRSATVTQTLRDRQRDTHTQCNCHTDTQRQTARHTRSATVTQTLRDRKTTAHSLTDLFLFKRFLNLLHWRQQSQVGTHLHQPTSRVWFRLLVFNGTFSTNTLHRATRVRMYGHGTRQIQLTNETIH